MKGNHFIDISNPDKEQSFPCKAVAIPCVKLIFKKHASQY